jgi:transaldolase/glucose-6-phosphate isomerase
MASMRGVLPTILAEAVDRERQLWDREGRVSRLWARDATLWTGADESRWLGWLDVAGRQRASLAEFEALRRWVAAEGLEQVVLLGMGGSSLCAEVLRMTFGRVVGAPDFHVLDSTAPAQVRACGDGVDLARTLFIVSSKSGTTLESAIFYEHFRARVEAAVGREAAGSRFVAVTDPGSALEQTARRSGFRQVVSGEPSIGGRYSALSAFGIVPAALMGLDVGRLLDRADAMRARCAPEVPAADNPGLALGLVLGVAARAGHDKLTIVTSPTYSSLGAWLEQLVAESTGKAGTGIIPVDGERLGSPAVYGNDRLFVYLRDEQAPAAEQDAAIDALEQAGHPVVRLSVADRFDLAGQFFRWEFATAVAGSVLGVNPFDQPDVEASKVATRALTDAYETGGNLPPEFPVAEDGSLTAYANDANLRAIVGTGRVSVKGLVATHLGRATAHDYVALLAYLEMSGAHMKALQRIRHVVRDRLRVATCLGFGPRFLHSTGQAYKGGPDSGVFLQVTGEDPSDLPVPGRRVSFGVVKRAQAQGDFEVLSTHRRTLRLHITGNLPDGLARIGAIIERVLP